MRVLVVEDDPELRQQLGVWLAREGYADRCAGSGPLPLAPGVGGWLAYLRTIPEIEVGPTADRQVDGRPGIDVRITARADACRATIERFRHEIATDTLDVVLLHCCMSPTWDRDLEPYRDVLSEAKTQAKVGAVGVSCHTLDALKTAAACPWVEVILARLNPRGASMDAAPDEVIPVLRQARQNGKAVIGMKIFGEGKLADEREACMQFAQENGLLDAMNAGIGVDALIRAMPIHPTVSELIPTVLGEMKPV